MNLKTKPPIKRALLNSAIALSLSGSAEAVDFPVTVPSDDGSGLVTGTLSHAILQANITPGDDSITLQTDVTINGVMKRLIDSNISIQSVDEQAPKFISGNNQHRPLFIKSGVVTLQSLTISGGSAKGGTADDGSPGAGMGGALFIYDGQVSINDVTFYASSAVGGNDATGTYTQGGGGMYGNAGNYGGGGLFASGSGNNGGYGGYGTYQDQAADFGQGGNYTGYIPAESGGFGGGGGWPSGDGGFGGGGAGNSGNNYAGNGGFGAGAPYAGNYGVYSGFPGYGASTNGAAGMGGAIFVRTGTIDINNSFFGVNTAYGSADAKGLGGAIFVVHSTENTNSGTPASQQGMPLQLAEVTGCGNTFSGNVASGDAGVADNDDDVFDLGGVAEDLTQLCPVQQNLVVTVSADNGLGDTANTLSWAIKESNAIPGDDSITLATDVTITGVMKRLIDSNVTIKSDGTRRTISGNDQFRPLFIKSGQVVLQNFDMTNGLAHGGQGFTGGAGMGGSLFIYAGDVSINDLSFSDSIASGGIDNSSLEGGGGMFGDGDDGGGGLFASASGDTGGHGGFYGNFGRGGGGNIGRNGQFGGGGLGDSFTSSGGDGGFGGGGGDGLIEGDGGFGGGSQGAPGFGATLHGAGMGGAVFIRSGDVTINNTGFNNNAAQATGGASGLAGALFVVHTTSNGNASQQGMPSTLATVEFCDVSFSGNSATHAAGSANDNNNWFSNSNQITECPIFKDGFE